MQKKIPLSQQRIELIPFLENLSKFLKTQVPEGHTISFVGTAYGRQPVREFYVVAHPTDMDDEELQERLIVPKRE